MLQPPASLRMTLLVAVTPWFNVMKYTGLWTAWQVLVTWKISVLSCLDSNWLLGVEFLIGIVRGGVASEAVFFKWAVAREP
jgi:hypothetical protein